MSFIRPPFIQGKPWLLCTYDLLSDSGLLVDLREKSRADNTESRHQRNHAPGTLGRFAQRENIPLSEFTLLLCND
jgi:hypothetical protein